jgi:hypothetical protein
MVRAWTIVVAIVLMLGVAACATGTDDQDGSSGPISGPSPPSSDEAENGSIPGSTLPAAPSDDRLEQTIVAFARCLAREANVTIRYRLDPFDGMSYSIQIPGAGRDDAERGTALEETCQEETSLDIVVTAYQAGNPLLPDDIAGLLAEFRACVASTSPAVEATIPELATLEDVGRFVAESMGTLPTEDWMLLSDCEQSTVYGPEHSYPVGGG